jgi:hypothetical protein
MMIHGVSASATFPLADHDQVDTAEKAIDFSVSISV